jgi:transcriptional regulator with XRE-family HTH domain
MTTKKDSSVAANKLRKIWDLRKSEIGITQTEAAKKLGWTQGALAQYLNNITELNPPAVTKLSNFLGVDPREIDPTADFHDYPQYLAFPTSRTSKITLDLSRKWKAHVHHDGSITLTPGKK